MKQDYVYPKAAFQALGRFGLPIQLFLLVFFPKHIMGQSHFFVEMEGNGMEMC